MPAPDNTTVLRITPLGWCGVALVLLAPWAVIAWQRSSPAPAAVPPVNRTAHALPSAPNAREGKLRPGAWGDLEFRSMMIEPPEAFIPLTETPLEPPQWTFKGYSEPALQALWQSAGLTATQRSAFDDATRRSVNAGDIVIRPLPEDVLGLGSNAREKIYTALAQFPENVAQHEPFRFRADSIDDWFEGSNISPEIVELTKRLLYQRNEIAIFSDQDLVLPRIPTSGERIRYLKALSRKSALLIHLRINPDSDAPALTRYWGKGRRSKDIEPLLTSLARNPTGAALDIVHLLPRFARALLYTYPLPSDSATDTAFDCHWTTFNFLREEPEQRFKDIAYVKQALDAQYYPVVGEPTFGDIILLLQPGGVVIHSCVFVADDIVFTKNGPGYSVPWLLSRLGNVVSFYGRGRKLETRRYRLKE